MGFDDLLQLEHPAQIPVTSNAAPLKTVLHYVVVEHGPILQEIDLLAAFRSAGGGQFDIDFRSPDQGDLILATENVEITGVNLFPVFFSSKQTFPGYTRIIPAETLQFAAKVGSAKGIQEILNAR